MIPDALSIAAQKLYTSINHKHSLEKTYDDGNGGHFVSNDYGEQIVSLSDGVNIPRNDTDLINDESKPKLNDQVGVLKLISNFTDALSWHLPYGTAKMGQSSKPSRHLKAIFGGKNKLGKTPSGHNRLPTHVLETNDQVTNRMNAVSKALNKFYNDAREQITALLTSLTNITNTLPEVQTE